MLLKLILSDIVANLAGPKRPQDLIPLTEMKARSTKQLLHLKETKDSVYLRKEFEKTATIEFADGDLSKSKLVLLQLLQSLHVQIHLTHTLC